MEISANQKVKRRQRRKTSPEAQKELCLKWQASGLTKKEFCKINDISLSGFYEWCKMIPETQEKPTWAPVIAPRIKLPLEEQEHAIIELSLPNHIVVKVKIALYNTMAFIQDLINATTTIR